MNSISEQKTLAGLHKIGTKVYAAREARVAELQQRVAAEPQASNELGRQLLPAKRIAEIYASRMVGE